MIPFVGAIVILPAKGSTLQLLCLTMCGDQELILSSTLQVIFQGIDIKYIS